MNREPYFCVKKYCEENDLLKPEQGVVLGVSGGADSVFLLKVMVFLRQSMGLKLHVVHVNHGLRGQAANEDEIYTEELAKRYQVSFRSFSVDLGEYARTQQQTLEEAGRYFRYECFENERLRLGYDKIAVAHHRDDQAETVILNLLRGSGLRGLGGMRPTRDHVIRPLLCLSKEQIQETLIEEGIPWQEDYTNGKTDYTRNKIRLELLPCMKQVQGQALEHIVETSEQLQMVWNYMNDNSKLIFQKLVQERENGIVFSARQFQQVHESLKAMILLEMMEKVCGSRKDLGKVQVQQILGLIDGPTGKKIDLPYQMVCGKDYDQVFILQKQPELEEVSGQKEAPFQVCYNLEKRENLPLKIPKNTYTKCFDYAKIKLTLVWRHPLEGDYIFLSSRGDKKRLSRIFIDEKTPKKRREQMWVLAQEDHVIWIPELDRVCPSVYVNEETKLVLVANVINSMKK